MFWISSQTLHLPKIARITNQTVLTLVFVLLFQLVQRKPSPFTGPTSQRWKVQTYCRRSYNYQKCCTKRCWKLQVSIFKSNLIYFDMKSEYCWVCGWDTGLKIQLYFEAQTHVVILKRWQKPRNIIVYLSRINYLSISSH